MAQVKIKVQDIERMNERELKQYLAYLIGEVVFLLNNLDENNFTKDFKERVLNGK